MSIAVAHAPETTCRPETPCAHCGLPVGRHPVEQNTQVFCCAGCATVYATLHAAGLGATFYRLRDQGSTAGAACPAPPSADPLLLAELDSEAFLDQHTRLHPDGTRSAELFLDGVHCAACVWLVERLPYEQDGVLEARLDLPRARLAVTWQPGRVALSDAARWLSRVGYAPHPVRPSEASQRTEAERRLLLKAGVCWALAGNVMLLASALYAGLDQSGDPGLAAAARWLSLGLAIPAVWYGGSEFFRKAWTSIRAGVLARSLRVLHMDTPISAGILIGFGHSAWATVSGHGAVWFDSITVLIAALLTARWLQLRSRRFAGDATERLLALIPTMVRRLEADGTVALVRGDSVRPDDLVEVPAGDVFPVDGLIASGRSTVNNAVLTGESRPLRVEPGQPVSAGATNLSAPVQVRVTGAGGDTRIGRLLTWIRDASSQRAPVVLLANRLSGLFAVSVLALAGVTAAIWLALAPEQAVPHVVALLVITCPCALGMATPLAMAVAAGRAARRGLFIKSDEAVQQLTAVDRVVLDKTGTLTEGTMTLVAFEGDESVLDPAAALETLSDHPLAHALVQARPAANGYTPGDFESLTGRGVRGTVGGVGLAVGQPGWIAAQAGPAPDAFARALAAYTAAGYTPVAVAMAGAWAAVLAFGDRLRSDAAEAVARLQAEGRSVYLLSGDHPEAVQHIARQLGLPPERAFGGVTPEEKQTFVEQLREEGAHTVAMVGDGVNDAAALQAADVGIAVQGGSTASLVAADVFLTQPGVRPLDLLFTGTRHVMQVVRRNLAFSLVYNLAGAAAAMLGLVSPLVAAVAMPVSSLIVVLSSMTQRSFVDR